jgi:asparagine synthase (glutamine-hydrolysing)
VATYLGTDHTELYVTPKDALSVIPLLPELYDEPFSDSSQIPTFLVAKMARQHVTVAWSGDAGEALFGGYNRYLWANVLWKRIYRIPMFMRDILTSGLENISPSLVNKLYSLSAGIIPEKFHIANAGDKAQKLARVFSATSMETIYYQLVSHWNNSTQIVIGGAEPPNLKIESMIGDQFPEFEHRMMYCDAITYLPDDILVKVDRAAMGVSLEMRIPFLDHRVVEFAWQLPLSMKIRNGRGKRILRRILQKYVPYELIDRPKMGFAIPLDFWLRGPLRAWSESLIEESRLKREGFLNPEPIQKKWQEFITGKRSWQYLIWDVLMFQAWRERWA